MARLRYIKLVVAILSVTIQLALSIKTNSRPVYEIINEQTKSDERLIKTSAVANLPYGNPLAGNSQQNAKLHAHNQQAMFNAERIRQHKAQLQQQQKWLKTPRVHNYMLTQESQENHQLALERAQADDIRDSKKTTKENDVLKEPERRRKHRSYGTEYKTYVVNNENLKPNIINEMAQTTNEFYPKNPSQRYPIQDIETLNSLLNKNPNDQLTEFNALINNPKNINHDKELEIPINLYFHLEPTKNPLPDHTRYAQIPIIQKSHEEYIPIKVDNDSEETPLYLQQENMEPVIKNIQYNTELNHIVNAGYNPLYEEILLHIKDSYHEIKEQHKPFNYIPIFNQNVDITEDLKRYLHHNKGIQHLNKDGADETAYDNLNYASSYEFGYRVRDMHSGNDFGHLEEKKGEETNGQYHVLLPDGRMQNVIYSAGPEGFHADISYEGRK